MSAGDRDTLAELLAEHGPDRYNEARCICKEKAPMGLGITGMKEWHRAHVAVVLLASDWLREHDRATYAHGYHHGYKDAAYDHDAAVYGDQDEYLIDRAERAAANQYRTTEDTDAH